MIVKLCDTRSNQAAPITDPCNGEFFDFLRAWSAIAENLIVWDYAICFVNPSVFFPFASEFAYADTFRTFHGNNVFGVFIDAEAAERCAADLIKEHRFCRVAEPVEQVII